MNDGRAILAALAGAAGARLSLPVAGIWLMMNFDFTLFATPEPPSAGEKFIVYVIAPVMLAAAGILPTRVLGAGWLLALLTSAGASIFVSLVVFFSGFEPGAPSFGLIAEPDLVALGASVRSGGDAPVIPALIFATGFLTIATAAMHFAEVFGLVALVSLSGWVVLLAIAGLFQPARRDARG